MNIKKKKKIIISLVIFGILLLIIIFITFNIFNNKMKKELPVMELDFESRIEMVETFDSGDYYTAGWLQVQGTNIDLPILLVGNNDDVDLDYSFGWRSPIYETGKNREVLLGHNVLNVSSTPMLSNENLMDFEALMSFSYYNFAKDNLYIQYTKDGNEYIYAIYAVGFYDYYYDNSESMSDRNIIGNYINDVRNNSIYDYDIDVNSDDTIITIKTCTRYFGLYEKQQFVIDARLLRDGEQILKYDVSENENYKELLENNDFS